MERFKLYNMLTDIPLFMGMDRIELEQIVSKTKLNFKKIAEGETIFIRTKFTNISRHLPLYKLTEYLAGCRFFHKPIKP